ncbi:crinkler family protein [Gigaspora margarita]|uniref:Crinkler family protein n=1 Tax=Gigaspora margarita TaxID=4874 RepID=A0A8H3XDL3_GIGMA|nr:crinkler family protein [Gigaspora margarita]
MLDDKSHKIDVEQDLGGIELFPANRILGDFYKQQLPLVKIIHIIIQVPATYGLGSTKLPYSVDHKLLRKVILVQVPPYSGKTSLAQLMEYYLVDSSEYFSKYRIIRVSMLWGSVVGVDCR